MGFPSSPLEYDWFSKASEMIFLFEYARIIIKIYSLHLFEFVYDWNLKNRSFLNLYLKYDNTRYSPPKYAIAR